MYLVLYIPVVWRFAYSTCTVCMYMYMYNTWPELDSYYQNYRSAELGTRGLHVSSLWYLLDLRASHLYEDTYDTTSPCHSFHFRPRHEPGWNRAEPCHDRSLDYCISSALHLVCSASRLTYSASNLFRIFVWKIDNIQSSYIRGCRPFEAKSGDNLVEADFLIGCRVFESVMHDKS